MHTEYTQPPLFKYEKRCGKCRQSLPPSGFYRDRTHWDGLATVCKDCDKAAAKAWRQAHPEQVRRQHALFRERHPDKMRLYKAKWVEKNPDAYKDIRRRFYERHADRLREQDRARRARNPEHQRNLRIAKKARRPEHYRQMEREATRRRNFRKKSGGALSSRGWLEIRERYGNKCLCCGTSEGITCDHIVPLSKGGLHEADNVQPLCMRCNLAKRTQTIDYRPSA